MEAGFLQGKVQYGYYVYLNINDHPHHQHGRLSSTSCGHLDLVLLVDLNHCQHDIHKMGGIRIVMHMQQHPKVSPGLDDAFAGKH